MSRVHLLELLGLHASATRDEIKSRYRDLARKFHPDVSVGDERSNARFRAIVAAYQSLIATEEEVVPERATYTLPPVKPGRSGDLAGDTASPTLPRSNDGLARRYAEARSRLNQCKKTMHRAQADLRDGDAKAFAARGRGDDQMARHFERRVEADRSRVYALLGEISGLERELRGLEAGPGGVDGEGRATHISPDGGSDQAERLNREVQKLHDEERATLIRKYKNNERRR